MGMRRRRGSRGGPKLNECLFSPCIAKDENMLQWVQCEICDCWAHVICAGLVNLEEASQYNYSCPQCRCNTKKRGICPGCSKSIATHQSGRFRVHGPVNNRCIFSNKLPVPVSDTEPNNAPIDATSFTANDFINVIKAFKCKTLKYVPKAARIHFSHAVNTALRAVINDTDSKTAWLNVFTIAHRCLKAPVRAGSAKKTSLATFVKRQIDVFLNEAAVRPVESKPRPRNNVMPDNEILSKLICEKINEGNIKAAVRIASSDKGVVLPSDENMKLLELKHPPEHPGRQAFPVTQEQPLEVSGSLVLSAVQSFATGSAGGPSGLRPQHLKDSLSSAATDAGNVLLNTLGDFVNLMLAGKASEFVRPVFASANLTTLSKKAGDLTPIAVGETLRRVVGKCAGQIETRRFLDFFAPFQMGAGAKNGAETAVHAARIFFENANDSDVFLKLDFSNAFNTIRRDKMALVFQEHCPELLPFYNMCYERPSFLIYGPHVLFSREGFQQGDPIASFGFCLSVHKCLRAIISRFKAGYMVDISAGDNWKIVLKDFIAFKEASEILGLKLNDTKCELTFLSKSEAQKIEIIQAFQAVCPGIIIVGRDDADLLGSPLGHKALEIALEKKRAKMNTLCDNLDHLPSHYAIYLLRHCFAMPKLIFLFRTAPTFSFPDIVQQITSDIRQAVQKISNVLIKDREWNQASLTCKMGGLGIQSPCDLSSSAYLASVFATKNAVARLISTDSPSVFLNKALDLWKAKTGLSDAFVNTTPHQQKSWYNPVLQQKKIIISANYNSDTDVARLKGCSAPGAGDWLAALLSDSLGLLLTDEAFRIAVGLRLGAPVLTTCTCACGTSCDKFGNHPLVCPKIKSRFVRHQLSNNIIRDAFTSAGVPSKLEPVGMLRDDGKRPDGATLVPWMNGAVLAWDFTCVSRLAASNVATGLQDGPSVANQAEVR